MLINTSVSAIALYETDFAALKFISWDVLTLFPDSTWARADLFPWSLVTVHRNYPRPNTLSYNQLLAAAYFGYLALPADYETFCAKAEYINRHRAEAEAVALRRDKMNRESEAAQHFGLANRRAMRDLYRALNLHTKQLDFPSIKTLWKCHAYIEKATGIATPEERKAFAAGPLFLWEFMQHARKLNLSEVAFGVHGNWVLYLHYVDDCVYAYSIYPASLRLGGFEETPFPETPAEVRNALRAMAHDRHPTVPEENVFIVDFPVFELATPRSTKARQEG